MKNYKVQKLVKDFNKLSEDQQIEFLSILDRSINESSENVSLQGIHAIGIIGNWLDSMGIHNYTINNDLTVDVDGDVDLYNKNLTKIPVQFNEVLGNFDCSYNNLESLEWHPKYVGGDFDCSHNPGLSTRYLDNFDFSFVHGRVYRD